MATWKNEGKFSVVVMHKLVYPGEVVEVPEKMVKALTPGSYRAGPLPSGEGEKKAKMAKKADPSPLRAQAPSPLPPLPEAGRGEEEGA